MNPTEAILKELRRERQTQLADRSDSNKKTLSDWYEAVTKPVNLLENNPQKFRESMIKTAAMAVAAAEWHDKNKMLMRNLNDVLVTKQKTPVTKKEKEIKGSHKGVKYTIDTAASDKLKKTGIDIEAEVKEGIEKGLDLEIKAGLAPKTKK